LKLPSFVIESLRIEGFRNLETSAFRPAPAINVLFGDNGQGKTSLLEAIYFVATTRSFRTARPREIVRHGAEGFSVRATFLERRPDLPSLSRAQAVALVDGAVQARIDGNKPASLAEYATRAPIVVFHPEELTLSTGPAALRRRLLDRITVYRAPHVVQTLARYQRATKSRQDLLRRSAGVGELSVYEELMAEAGAAITRARRDAIDLLLPATLSAFEKIAPRGLELGIEYRAGGAPSIEEARAELERRRDRDRRTIAASFGPHRDDVELRLGGKRAKEVASQGQHRMITLALKAAERAAVASITGLEPIQLLDDVSSELDSERTAALLDYLDESRGQVFITTPRPEVLTPLLTRRSAGREGGDDERLSSLFQIVGGALRIA